METSKHKVTLDANELADLIESYDDKLLLVTNDPEQYTLWKERLKALLFDVRKEFVFALRLIEVETETKKAP